MEKYLSNIDNGIAEQKVDVWSHTPAQKNSLKIVLRVYIFDEPLPQKTPSKIFQPPPPYKILNIPRPTKQSKRLRKF